MKKISLSLAVVAIALSACQVEAPKQADPNELSPGLMQPVDGSGAQAGSYGWDAGIQPASMPSSMK